jgi:hypothetical protein
LFSAGETIGLGLMTRLQPQRMVTCKIITALAGTASAFVGARMYGTPGVVASLLFFGIFYLTWMAILGRASDLEYRVDVAVDQPCS